MSKQLINQYYNNLDRAIQFGKSTNETAMRDHFWILLNDYARKQNYEVVKEVSCLGSKGKKVYPDGIVKNLFGLDIGLWESKDEKTSIDDEIGQKIRDGYPLTNILFEDSATAILYQRGELSMRIPMRDADKLHQLITAFVTFKNETVHKFEVALENFKADIPKIVEALRAQIEATGKTNQSFIAVRDTFLELCKVEINPEITLADVREMMIQHILTSDIFNRIFNDADFHRHNTIARELENLINALFNYSERRNLLGNIEHYYDAISAAASEVTDHHEKQKFLKVLYENFYKVYNPKAADRLGVVYTPNEIVQFMVQSTDYLLEKHFGKTLADENVDILDPATGTGTFITSIIDHIPKHLLSNKYKNELHANEVAILPYYIANLNVEFTFKQKMGYYEEFVNLCFVDTLDNVASLKFAKKDAGHQTGMFGLSSENSERIKKQNEKRISVVIGNPPYNANQANENDNNKNREYPIIDKHIKETFIKQSTAQKTKVYDMYARFYRWAMDRLDNNGIIAFITNRSFIDSRTFDGFRKCVEQDFSNCYIIDTHSDVRVNPKIAGTTQNVFGIQTGVAVMFLVKKENKESRCRIEYMDMPDEWRKEEKLSWFKNNHLETIPFKRVEPDKKSNWINLADSDFESLIPICNKDVKSGKSKEAVFELYSTGISTNRDEWVIDFSQKGLINMMSYFTNEYNNLLKKKDFSFPNTIKWSRNLKVRFKNGLEEKFNEKSIIKYNHRPYTPTYLYHSKVFLDEHGLSEKIFNNINLALCISGNGSSKPFQILGVTNFHSLDYLEKTQCLPLYIYDKSGNRKDNITDWALNLFKDHYQSLATADTKLSAKTGAEPAAFTNKKAITKDDIFHYTYAVLHNPAYRKKYELDLKREFPRLPLYDDFYQWAAWGKQLMNLHINYETVEQYLLKLIGTKAGIDEAKVSAFSNIICEPEALYKTQSKIKVKLKADKANGIIELDEQTALSGIPKQAWEYKLGNRSALEWVLDQYKEKKHVDPTIAEKFNTYRFADYKEHVIDLLKRVCTVSVETVRIVGEMENS
ncbi:MAG TPA: type ISP restriction/modification enzyme [Mucilaginibacter sp.]